MGNLTSQSNVLRINTRITSAHGEVVPEAVLTLDERATFDSATGTYQISTNVTGSSDAIDLVGSLLDDLGDIIQFDKVHLLHYHNTGSAGSSLSFSDDFGFTSAIALAGGSHVTYTNENGVQLTGGTADTVTVAGTTGIPYDVVVIGLKL